MARTLDQATTTQITQKNISAKFTFKINNVDYTDYVLDWAISYNTQFGSASASFTLNNNGGVFGAGGATPINVGDEISLTEQFVGSTTEWKSFYGKVEQRSIINSSSSRTIQLTCLDYISVLKQWDVDLIAEGTKVEVRNEVLAPQFLPSPNDTLAQVFNFANNAIADIPRPILSFRDKAQLTEDPQYDGFDVYYNVGQVKLGSPLQAEDNYDLIAKSYYFYTDGIFCEDVLEQLLTQVNGYGKYLFDETSAEDVITKHLTTTYYAEEGTYTDIMTSNASTSTIVIKHSLVRPTSKGDTAIYLDSVDGLPASGQGSINGDIFTWGGIESGNILMAIPDYGEYSLSAHPAGARVQYSTTYPTGQVWYLKYSNVTTSLVDSNFTIPFGASVQYFDKRNGRIILDSGIPMTAYVTCNVDYTFKTLQTAGVELNYIAFRPRELKNRYEAIDKLRKYLPPNYIIRTQGDDKIWASLMYQKYTADYDLNLVSAVNYHEEEDLYTRVIFYGKNNNPTNLMFNPNISFGTTGASYKAYASQSELIYYQSDDSYHYFLSGISNAGRILLDNYTPIVYINGLPIDDKLHQLSAQPMKFTLTTRTETQTTTSGGKHPTTTTTTHTYYYYIIYFTHQSIAPTQNIIIYDLFGTARMTIGPYDSNMDYGKGMYVVPGSSKNSTVEMLSTATYYVHYSSNNLVIDYDNVIFKINRTMLPQPETVTVQASFEYYATFTPAIGAAALIDGRWDTQVQTEFYAEPPSGYEYAVIDFGSIQTMQAIDVIGGFYKPDDFRKFDLDFRFSVYYSLNGTDYYEISDETHNVQLTGGSSVSFDEDDLGVGFQARYLKIVLENVKKLDYGSVMDASGNVIRSGMWAVAISEVSAFSDIILKSEASLIPTTTLTQDIDGSGTVYVTSTAGFTEPGSGETATVYVSNLSSQAFTYTGVTATTFEGVTLISGCSGLQGATIAQTITTSTTLQDPDGLLPHLGDRLYKNLEIDEDILYDQTTLDSISIAYLKEFYKNHSKLSVEVMYAPYLKLGQTVSLTDSYNHISNGLYFIESISSRPSGYQLTLGKYPA